MARSGRMSAPGSILEACRMGWVRTHRRRLARIAVLAVVLAQAAGAAAWARGPWRAGATNTAGWQFMSPEERVEHQRRLRRFETFDACAAYQAEHHALMAERAQRAGVALQPERLGACAQLRAQGHLK
jgi:hypothetical protein